MSSPGRSTVYVVDDDPGVLGSLRFLLEADGFDVRTFRSAAALLEADVMKPVGCFVIDYKMDSMDGIDLAIRLRDLAVTAPIILITGYPDESIPGKAAAAGVQMVLTKPNVDGSLVAHIRTAMQDEKAGLRH